MRKKIIVTLFALIICILCSIGIQKGSGRWYSEPLAKVEQVKIQEDQQIVRAIQVNGPKKGQEIQLTSSYQKNEIESVHLKRGNQVFYRDGVVTEKKRDGFVFFIVSLLLLTLIVVGGRTGLTSFISVTLNSAMLYLMVWFYRNHPHVPLLQVASLYTVVAIAVTLFLIDGIQKNSLKKFFASVVTVFVAFFICYFTMALLHDKGLRFEDFGVMTRPYRPIFLASLLIGVIGAALDTVVTVISTLDEISVHNQRLTLKELIKSGKIIGEDISGAMVNVLICSYFSSAIPLILLYLMNGWSFFQTINMQLSVEALRVLCGGFGIILSIPISLGFFALGKGRAK